MEVFNVSVTGSKVHVGKGSIPLKSSIKAPNETCQLVVELTHEAKKKNIKQGKAFLTCILKTKQEKKVEEVEVPKKPPVETPQPTAAPAANLPANAATAHQKESTPPVTTAPNKAVEVPTKGVNNTKETVPVKGPALEQRILPTLLPARKYKFTGSKFVATDLFDTGSMLDGQDPCLQLTLAGKSFETARQQDAGTRAKFPETFEWTLTSEEIERGAKVNSL